MATAPDNQLRIQYVKNAQNMQEFQEIAVAIRSMGDIRRLFTYSARKAIVIRATPDQAALFAWLLPLLDKALNQTIQHAISPQYLFDDPHHESVTEVFYAGNAAKRKGLAGTRRNITPIYISQAPVHIQ